MPLPEFLRAGNKCNTSRSKKCGRTCIPKTKVCHTGLESEDEVVTPPPETTTPSCTAPSDIEAREEAKASLQLEVAEKQAELEALEAFQSPDEKLDSILEMVQQILGANVTAKELEAQVDKAVGGGAAAAANPASASAEEKIVLQRGLIEKLQKEKGVLQASIDECSAKLIEKEKIIADLRAGVGEMQAVAAAPAPAAPVVVAVPTAVPLSAAPAASPPPPRAAAAAAAQQAAEPVPVSEVEMDSLAAAAFEGTDETVKRGWKTLVEILGKGIYGDAGKAQVELPAEQNGGINAISLENYTRGQSLAFKQLVLAAYIIYSMQTFYNKSEEFTEAIRADFSVDKIKATVKDDASLSKMADKFVKAWKEEFIAVAKKSDWSAWAPTNLWKFGRKNTKEKMITAINAFMCRLWGQSRGSFCSEAGLGV